MKKLYFIIILLLSISVVSFARSYYVWGAPVPDEDGYWGNDSSEIVEALVYSLSKTIEHEDSLCTTFNRERKIVICEDGLPQRNEYWEKLSNAVPSKDIWTYSLKQDNDAKRKVSKLFGKGKPLYIVNLDLKGNVLAIEVMPKFAFYDKRVIIAELQRRIYKYTFTLNCSIMNWEPSGLEISCQSE